jgi:hypothetical protein
MLCAVCTVHVETSSVGFLVEPQNQGRWFVSGLASKPLCHAPFQESGNKASICVPRMFKSHVQEQYDKQVACSII